MPNVLNDHRMDYLFEAVRLGSIRAAADVLEVNPSVISRQIAQLEKDIGVTLIERLSRGVRATQAGLLLTQRHRQWMADREDTIAKLREIQGLKRGHIDIVLGEGFVSDLMAGPLLQFWQRHPQLTMSVELAGTSEVVASVAEDRAHIGMVYNPPHDPRLRVVAASRQPIRLVARPDHPLAKSPKPPTLADITAYPLGLMYLNYGTRQVVKLAGAEETRLISETTAVIAAFESKAPAGWLGPWISQSAVTPDLLQEAGYTYLLDWCMDDQPVWMKTRNGGRILSVPYPQEINDIPSIVAGKDSACQFADMIIGNFDEMLEQAQKQPLVMGIALHPYLVGQPYRLRELRRALSHIGRSREDIWFTTAGAIAGHAAEVLQA